MARPHETSTKKSRKCKPPKASFGLFEAPALEPSKELEPELKVLDEVQDSPVPSPGNPVEYFAEGESSQAPSEAPPVAPSQDTNVLVSSFLKKMTDLMGILTTQLKPNEATTSGSIGAKVVKRLPIKIPPPKAFERDRDYKRVATWLRKVENFFLAMAVEEHQKVQMTAGLLGKDALIWWAEYIKDQRIGEVRCSG